MTFAGLAYQTVPVSTTQTMTEQSTQIGISHSVYPMTSTIAYLTQVFVTSIYSLPARTVCAGLYPPTCIGYPPTTNTRNIPTIQTAQSTFETQSTATISYTQTVTSSTTKSSTKIVPAYSSLGLSVTSFGALSLLVIGVLAIVTGWFALKSSHGPKQAAVEKFERASNSCVKCGADLPPNSAFCNKCGTQQP